MEKLRIGLDFAVKYQLSVKEMTVLVIFFDGPCSSTEIAKRMNTKLNTAHAIITRLKHKGIIKSEESDGKFKLYKFIL